MVPIKYDVADDQFKNIMLKAVTVENIYCNYTSFMFNYLAKFAENNKQTILEKAPNRKERSHLEKLIKEDIISFKNKSKRLLGTGFKFASDFLENQFPHDSNLIKFAYVTEMFTNKMFDLYSKIEAEDTEIAPAILVKDELGDVEIQGVKYKLIY